MPRWVRRWWSFQCVALTLAVRDAVSQGVVVTPVFPSPFPVGADDSYQVIEEGQNFRVEERFDLFGATVVRWTRDGQVVRTTNVSGPATDTLTFVANTSDTGTYRAEASGSGRVEQSRPHTLVVLPARAPTITRQPALEPWDRDGLMLSVSATGSAPLNYQWFRDGVAIAGHTDAYVTIAPGKSATGTYRVEVSNRAATTRSNDVTVAEPPNPIVPPPTIIAAPASADLIAGERLVLSAQGTWVMNEQWQKDGRSVSAASGSYIVEHVTNADAGHYRVTLSNETGAVRSNEAIVTIVPATDAPRFRQHPQAQPIAPTEGENVFFSVDVVGASPVTLQWLKNGNVVPGATDRQFRLGRVTTADAASYRVRATNAFGAVDSQDAQIAIAPTVAPIVLEQPKGGNVDIGADFDLWVYAGDAGSNTYQWFRNDQPFGAPSSSNVVTLRLFDPTQAGRYRVRVTNLAGTALSDEAIVNVSPLGGAPVVVDPPHDVVIAPGADATVAVKARGSEVAWSYQWRKDGQTLVGQTRAALQIASASAVDAGVYAVTVSNRFGSANAAATVTVTGGGAADTAPRVIDYPGAASSVRGQPLAIAPKVVAKPAAAFQWLRNGTVLVGATRAALTIDRVAPTDEGTYVLVASNALGSAQTDRIVVTARTAPGRLTNLSVRADIAARDNLIMGFVADGDGTRSLLVRAAGPALSVFGVARPMADPKLEIRRDTGDKVAENDDWDGSVSLVNLMSSVGAFGLPVGSSDSAVSRSFSGGVYTVVVADNRGIGGTVVAELYTADDPARPRIVNLSCRLTTRPDARTLTLGFVVLDEPARLLIRAIGPSLRWFGVANTVDHPTMRLYRGSIPQFMNVVGAGNPGLNDAMAQTGAFAVAKEAGDTATVVTLEPGVYSVQITGADGESGDVLGEIYELLEPEPDIAVLPVP